jgi:4-amino-4-deoxy-L-arabinose transferase-like glycosyltransferase
VSEDPTETSAPRPILRRTWNWFATNGHNRGYELGIVDEIFAIFAGITLFVANTDWLKEGHREIIYTIFISVSLVVIVIVLAINQTHFWPRALLNMLAVALAFAGVDMIMRVSLHDLAPQSEALEALPIGVIAWAFVREIAVFLLNRLPDFRPDERASRKSDA